MRLCLLELVANGYWYDMLMLVLILAHFVSR